MSEQFHYVRFSLKPRSDSGNPRLIVLELPRRLVENWKREKPEQRLTDPSVAAEIAKVVAFVAVDADSPIPNRSEYELIETAWFDERHPVMNARPCNYHDNGIRAWVLVPSEIDR